jgi:ribonuclease HI
MKNAQVWTDGGSRGNPGHGAIGVYVRFDNGETIHSSKYIGAKVTNNQAEYAALLHALTLLVEEEDVEKVLVYADSELMVKQMKGLYEVKDTKIRVLYDKIIKLLLNFKEFAIIHIPREQNKVADGLVNEALDRKLKK